MNLNKLIDLEHPFFARLWIRVIVVATAFFWGLVECFVGNPIWGVVFLAIAAFCSWRFYTIDYSVTSDK